MKMKLLGLLIIFALISITGCSTVYKFAQEQAWKAEIKQCDKYIDGELDKELYKAVKSGDLTQNQADLMREKTVIALEWIKARAEKKLAERETE